MGARGLGVRLGGVGVFVQQHARFAQNFRRHSVALTDEAKEEMLGPDVIMVEALGFFLCQAQHFASPLGKLIESVSVVHLMYPPFQGLGWNRAPPSQVNLVLMIRHPRLSVKEAHPYKSAIQAVLRVLVNTRQPAGKWMVVRAFGVLCCSHQSEWRRAATGDTVFRPGFRAMEAPVAHS